MCKMNKNGFVLMETLIVSVFVMALFTVLYTNVFPLIGQYESRENYDDIDSKYTAHWVRKMVLDKGKEGVYNFSGTTTWRNAGYLDLTNCSSTYFTDVTYCLNLKENFHITKMYLTKYVLETNTLKARLKNAYSSTEFRNYIDYLPEFSSDANKKDYSRVIVEIDHGSYKSYGTIEVMG